LNQGRPKQLKITVILCTYNRCGLLAAALESVVHSQIPEAIAWEILVVDNNSSDRTREAVEVFSSRYPGRVRYLFVAKQGKSNALNAGIEAANGEVLAFVDDDVTVDPMWLQHLTWPLLDGKWAGSGGRIFPQWDAPPPRWLAPQGWPVSGPLVYFDRGTEAGELKESPVGANMAFRKEMFTKYGGFRTDLGPRPGSEVRNEDSELARRLLAGGERLYYEPSAIVYHVITPERLNRRYFLTWWFAKGRSEVRESGIPSDGRRRLGGIPLYLFKRLVKWSLKWATAVDPLVRFECKLSVWLNAGMIAECYSAPTARPVLSTAESSVGNRP
jgi:glycosyltransferase involved in cell wall biosynthesis